MKKTSSILYPVKRNLKYEQLQSQKRDIECHKNLNSINRQKTSRRTRYISKMRVVSLELQASTKLQVISLYIKITNCKL